MQRESLTLANKHVLVFGGNSGMGLATAIQAKALGARVTITGRNAEKTRRIADLHQFDHFFAADITDKQAVNQQLSTIDHIDHLVLFSGSFIKTSVLDATEEQIFQAYNERIFSTINVIKQLSGKLSQQGSILFVSGLIVDRPNGFGTALMSSSAAAVELLAKSLAFELAPIRVNILSPGYVETPIFDGAFGEQRDEMVAHLASTLPARRLGTPEEAAHAAIYLMTNSWMNAATLNLDGAGRYS